MPIVLVTCGLVLAGVGTWTGYRHAREAIVPAAQPGDPTRSAIDAARPLHARAGVRRFARSVAAAVAWLALALYGLFLAQTGAILAGLA
jgi:hypothetical protein